jgi:luciferase family oxidoreductase group 1
MLTHYSPLKVAEQFRMLELLNPGRIDLGVGRAPGGDPRTAQALQAGPQSFGIDAFPSQVFLLKQFLDDASGRAPMPDDHPYRGIRAQPYGDTRPEMWMLGSSMNGGVFGAELGLPYSHAHFINPETSMESVAAYRERFKPTDWCEKPRVSLGVAVLAADTDEEARKLSASRNRWVVRLLSGQPIPILSPEEANALPLNAREQELLDVIEQRTFVGTADKLKPRLIALAERHGAEELVLLTITYDFAARMRSYELLAKEFGLSPAAEAR